jgi:hypothetical protein
MPECLVAEFKSPDDAVAAAVTLRALGYTRLDAFMPYPVPALEEALEVKRSRIPFVAFAAGATGCLLAYLIIWSTNAYDYPLIVGARPLDSLPADIPLMFESTVLIAGIAAFALVFLRSGLPRLHHPVMEIDGFERVSLDRFWLVVDAPAVDPDIRDRLLALGAVTVRGTESAASR